MNLVKQTLFAATLAITAGAAFAESPIADNDRFMSTQSRAEVRAETLQAIRDGSIVVGGELALTMRPAKAGAKSAASRDSVRALASAPKAAVWGMVEAP